MALERETEQVPELLPSRVADRARGWYRGDCHVHSVYSDGKLTPERLAADARVAGLDFVATTEHNTVAGHGPWRAQTSDRLLVILGEEVTTPTGHWLALGIQPGQLIDWGYRAQDDLVAQHLEMVHGAGGLCVAAHPHAPFASGVFAYPFPAFDVVEVWNGLWASDRPWNADNEAALAEWDSSLAADLPGGQWRPAMGNSDTHLEGQIGTPHTVVLADELSTAAVLAGIRAGRSWIAESAAVGLSVTAAAGDRSAGIGECLITGGESVTVRAEVRGVPSGTVSFHTDRGTVRRASLPCAGPGTAAWSTGPDGADGADRAAFVRVEVRHPGGSMAALTNPIILSQAGRTDRGR